jgi:hypothetical protein
VREQFVKLSLHSPGLVKAAAVNARRLDIEMSPKMRAWGGHCVSRMNTSLAKPGRALPRLAMPYPVIAPFGGEFAGLA